MLFLAFFLKLKASIYYFKQLYERVSNKHVREDMNKLWEFTKHEILATPATLLAFLRTKTTELLCKLLSICLQFSIISPISK